jgi:hypothetical protein
MVLSLTLLIEIIFKIGRALGTFFNKNDYISLMTWSKCNMKNGFCRLDYGESSARNCKAQSLRPVEKIIIMWVAKVVETTKIGSVKIIISPLWLNLKTI